MQNSVSRRDLLRSGALAAAACAISPAARTNSAQAQPAQVTGQP